MSNFFFKKQEPPWSFNFQVKIKSDSSLDSTFTVALINHTEIIFCYIYSSQGFGHYQSLEVEKMPELKVYRFLFMPHGAMAYL